MARQVTVTGATGFIASHLIKQLLEKGYTVRATVRSKSSSKAEHITRLAAGSPGKLELFEADLLQEGSFDEAVKGSYFVFHTASPVVFKVDDPQRDLVDPALKGTLNVLSSVAKTKDTVKRVILTSSFAAIRSRLANAQGIHVPKNGWLFTEEDWNEYSELETEPYFVSKVQAEKAAWAYAQEHTMDLITINPTFVIGPLIFPGDSLTPKVITSVLEGSFQEIFTTFVDVRDVARAHILAAEVPTAKGRYIVGHITPFSTKWLSQILQARFPEYLIPDGDPKQYPQMLNNSKVQRELGLTFRPLQETVVDAVTTILNLGVATPQPNPAYQGGAGAQ